MSVSKDMMKQLESLDGWDRGSVMLALFMGAHIDDKKLEQLQTAVYSMYEWHEKQHPNNKQCERCDLMNEIVSMMRVISLYYDEYKKF